MLHHVLRFLRLVAAIKLALNLAELPVEVGGIEIIAPDSDHAILDRHRRHESVHEAFIEGIQNFGTIERQPIISAALIGRYSSTDGLPPRVCLSPKH